MLKVTVEKRRKFEHIIGNEFEESFVFDPNRHRINRFIDPLLLDQLDAETQDYHEDELDSIYNNINGSHYIGSPDWNYIITIEEEE